MTSGTNYKAVPVTEQVDSHKQVFKLLNGTIHSAFLFVGNEGRPGILHVSKIVYSLYTKIRPHSVQFNSIQLK